MCSRTISEMIRHCQLPPPPLLFHFIKPWFHSGISAACESVCCRHSLSLCCAELSVREVTGSELRLQTSHRIWYVSDAFADSVPTNIQVVSRRVGQRSALLLRVVFTSFAVTRLQTLAAAPCGAFNPTFIIHLFPPRRSLPSERHVCCVGGSGSESGHLQRWGRSSERNRDVIWKIFHESRFLLCILFEVCTRVIPNVFGPCGGPCHLSSFSVQVMGTAVPFTVLNL